MRYLASIGTLLGLSVFMACAQENVPPHTNSKYCNVYP